MQPSAGQRDRATEAERGRRWVDAEKETGGARAGQAEERVSRGPRVAQGGGVIQGPLEPQARQASRVRPGLASTQPSDPPWGLLRTPFVTGSRHVCRAALARGRWPRPSAAAQPAARQAAEHRLRHLFILSAAMPELRSRARGLGDAAFLDAGLTAQRRAGQRARLAPGDVPACLEGGQPQPPRTPGAAWGWGGGEAPRAQAPLCPSPSVPFVLTTALPGASGG